MSNKDNSISFGMGILAGVLGGLIGALLYTPKKGEEMREEIKDVVVDMAEKYAPQVREAKKQALESIDVVRFKIEKEYSKINDTIKAKQLAKAKELEGEEYNL